jgi:hypothetical protein
MSMYVPVFEQIVIMPIVNVTPGLNVSAAARSRCSKMCGAEARVRRQAFSDHMAEIDQLRPSIVHVTGRLNWQAMPRA